MGTPRNSAVPGIDEYVADRFRVELFARRIRQAKVAEALHLTQPTVSSRLNGQTPMTASEIATLASLLGKPVGHFFPDDETELLRLDSNQQPTD